MSRPVTRSYTKTHNNLASEPVVMGDSDQLKTRVHDLEHQLLESSKEVREIKDDVRELRCLLELHFSSKEKSSEGAIITNNR